MNPPKLLEKIGRGEMANIGFSDLTRLVEALGFELDRARGSHRLYRHPRTIERINLQPLRNGEPSRIRCASS